MSGTDIVTIIVLSVFALYLTFGAIRYCLAIKEKRSRRSMQGSQYRTSRTRFSSYTLAPILRAVKTSKIRKHYGKEAELVASRDILSLVLPSVLGMLLCAVCLAGSTFAWFTASTSTDTQILTGASYRAQVTVLEGITPITPDNGNYTLSAPATYTVILHAEGSAQNGFCIIDINGTEVHTMPIKPSEVLTFTLNTTEATVLSIRAQWGHSSVADGNKIGNGDTYPKISAAADTPAEAPTAPSTPEPTPPSAEPQSSYTVQKGDRLSDVALLFGVSVEELAEFNKIADPDLIYEGQIIYDPRAKQ